MNNNPRGWSPLTGDSSLMTETMKELLTEIYGHPPVFPVRFWYVQQNALRSLLVWNLRR